MRPPATNGPFRPRVPAGRPDVMLVVAGALTLLAVALLAGVVATSAGEGLLLAALVGLALVAAGAVGLAVGDRRDQRYVVALAILAVAVRIAFGAGLFAVSPVEDPHIMGNSRSYSKAALRWMNEGGGWFYQGGEQHPGFAQFLVLIYKTFGITHINSFIPIVFIALLGGLIAPFTYRFVTSFASPAVARTAGLVAALMPEFVFHSSIVIRDQVIALGFVVALCGVARAVRRRRSGTAPRAVKRAESRRNLLVGVALLVAGVALVSFFKATYAFFAGALVFGIMIGYRSLDRAVLLSLPLVVTLVGGLVVLDAVGSDMRYLGTGGTPTKLLSGQWLVEKFEGATAAEAANPIKDSSQARQIFLALPAFASIPLQAVWGSAAPMLPLGAFWDDPGVRMSFFFRAFTWQLALPFLAYFAWRGLTARTLSFHERFMGLATIFILVFPAVLNIADTWDNTRYRSTGVTFLAAALALSWHHARKSPVARRQIGLIAVTLAALNLAYLGLSLLEQEFIRIPAMSLSLSSWIAFAVAPFSQGPSKTLQLALAFLHTGLFFLGARLLWPVRAGSPVPAERPDPATPRSTEG